MCNPPEDRRPLRPLGLSRTPHHVVKTLCARPLWRPRARHKTADPVTLLDHQLPRDSKGFVLAVTKLVPATQLATMPLRRIPEYEDQIQVRLMYLAV
jgi:hypothetical protein